MRSWKAHPGQIGWLSFSPDGAMLASCSVAEPCVRVWHPATGTESHRLATDSAGWHPTCLAFTPDSGWLAVAWVHADSGALIQLWHLSAGTPELWREFPVDAPAVGALAFAPAVVSTTTLFAETSAGAVPHLAAADFTRLLVYRRVADRSAEPPFPVVLGRGPDRKSPRASRVAVSPDGRWLASNGRTRSVVWEVPRYRPRFARTFPRSPHNGPLAFDAQSRTLAIAHGTRADLWHFQEVATRPVQLVGHKLPVWGVHISPDGTRAQTSSSDGTVRTWDADTGSLLSTYDWKLGKLYSATFSTDGTLGAAGTADGRIVLWDIEG